MNHRWVDFDGSQGISYYIEDGSGRVVASVAKDSLCALTYRATRWDDRAVFRHIGIFVDESGAIALRKAKEAVEATFKVKQFVA